MLSASAFGAAYVLLTFTALPTTLADVVRPLILIVTGAVVVTIVVALLLRSIPWAVIATSAFVLAAGAPYVFASAVVVGILVLGVQLVRHEWTWSGIRAARPDRFARGVAVFASGYLIVALALFVPPAIASIPSADRYPGAPADDLPNVYLLLLDGYPRSDTLASVFDYDNRPFELALEGMGFRIADESRSSYAHSWVSLTSMVHGSHIEDIAQLAPLADAAANEQFRALMLALNEGTMVDLFRQNGYRIAAIPPPHQSLGLSTADEYLDSGHMSDFEYSLLIHSQIGRAVMPLVRDFIADQVRGRFQATLDTIETVARSEADRPELLLAHVHSPPHAPLVYDADGQPLPLDACVPVTCTLWEYPDSGWAGLTDQLRYLNGRLLTTLESVIEADPTAVIVLTADHGSRYSSDDLGEYFRIFFAARTPAADPFPRDVHTANILRHLADAYLGTDLGEVDHRTWYSPILNQPLNLEPYEP